MKSSFPLWFLWGEKKSLKVIRILVLLIVIVQLFLFNDTSRTYLSRVDQIEGDTIDLYRNNNQTTSPHITVLSEYKNLLKIRKKLQLRMIVPEKSEKVFLFVNGKVVTSFSEGVVNLSISNGDYVEIDCTLLREPVKIIVKTYGVDMGNLVDGLVLEGKSEFISLGKIKIPQN